MKIFLISGGRGIKTFTVKFHHHFPLFHGKHRIKVCVIAEIRVTCSCRKRKIAEIRCRIPNTQGRPGSELD